MIRVLFFLLLIGAIAFGFAWLADRPGDLVVTFDGYQYQVTLMVAAVAVAGLVAAVMLAWWVVKAIWNSPYTITRYFRVRRRDRGYQALSTGMIAAGAGDALLARQKNKEALKLISSDQEPLIHLLEAQTLVLEGNHDAARDKFEQMIDDPETRLLGLRGLYLEAERMGNRDAARHYASRAAQVAPQLGWAAESTIEEKAEEGDWDAALKLLEAQKGALKSDREAFNRRRAVLLTANAMASFDTDPGAARAAALEANRLAPHFIPAALIAARSLFRSDEVRKGSKILEAAWRKQPHPEIAELYVHARHGDAALDRLARAQRLRSLHTNNAESALTVSRAAFAAQEFALAREEAQASIRLEPRESAYLLLADIEEADGGDAGRVREWLARAVRAPRDPAWVADGVISEHWAPQSPVTGKIDAFQWRVPVERLGPAIEQEEPNAPVLIEAEPEPVEEAEIVEEAPAVIDVETATEPVEANGEEISASPAEPAQEKDEIKDNKPGESKPLRAANDHPPLRDFAGEEKRPEIVRRLPDDPGVSPEEEKASGRFRLF
ncbi:MAG: heme biosynthesis protein HemY [Rhizobiaceae bacterium]|nr:heme biosynthesis protein HemY [Rhizobiaceae bacterium]